MKNPLKRLTRWLWNWTRRRKPARNRPKLAVLRDENGKVWRDGNGRKWYAYADAAAMPAKRMIAMEQARAWEEKRFTPQQLDAALENCVAQINQGNMAAAAAVIFDARARLSLKIEEESLWSIAAALFVSKEEFEEEQAHDYNPAEHQAKIEYWKKTPGCFDFFLPKVLKEFLGFTTISAETIRAYTAQTRELIAEEKRRLLTPLRGSSSNGTTSSTPSPEEVSLKFNPPKKKR